MTCKSDGCKAEVIFKTSDRRQTRGPGGAPPPQQFPPGPHGPRIFSKYCVRHTCDFFYEQDGCQFKRPHYDLVCAVHARCPIQGCNECKSQYVDPKHDQSQGLKYMRHPFCAEHKCSVTQCPMRRSQRQQGGPFVPFCVNHRCQVDGCKKERSPPYNYCAEHGCKADDCETAVKAGYELCLGHLTCEVRQCKSLRHKIIKTKDEKKDIPDRDLLTYGIEEYGKSQYLPYCLEHGTCETTGCGGFGTPTSRHCPKHTCPERDCKISSGANHYCDSHRCEAQGCQSPKGWKKNLRDREKFCLMHTCRKKDCTGETADLHLFCAKHECGKGSCVAEGVAEKLCIAHFKSQYQNDGKSQAKSEILELLRLSSRGKDGGFPDEDGFVRLGDGNRPA